MRLALAACLVLAPLALAAPAPLPPQGQDDTRARNELAGLQGTWLHYQYDRSTGCFKGDDHGKPFTFIVRGRDFSVPVRNPERAQNKSKIEIDPRGPRLRLVSKPHIDNWITYLRDGQWLRLGCAPPIKYFRRQQNGEELTGPPLIVAGPANPKFYIGVFSR
jgi:hypothetical protein